MSGRSHAHTHLFERSNIEHEREHDHHHENDATQSSVPAFARSGVSDRTAIVSLFALLTFSPCEAFLPIYVSGIRFGWAGFSLLTLILSVATVTGMLFFTWLTLAGIGRLRLRWLEQHESGVMGSLLLAVGLLVMLFEK
jgi:Fe2+ transport system protein B